MAAPRYKLRRKELREPDRLLTAFESLREFVSQNLTRMAIYVGAAAAIAALVVGSKLYSGYRSRIAANEFYQAFAELDHKQYQQAEHLFRDLAARNPRLEVGRLARFYLGTCYFAQGDYKGARDQLVEFLATNRDPLFGNFAMIDLGVAYEQLGNLKDAAATYQRAAATPGPEQERAELAAARILALEGNKAEAINTYRSFLAHHPYATERQEVAEALAQLGAAPAASERSAAGAAPAARPASR